MKEVTLTLSDTNECLPVIARLTVHIPWDMNRAGERRILLATSGGII